MLFNLDVNLNGNTFWPVARGLCDQLVEDWGNLGENCSDEGEEKALARIFDRVDLVNKIVDMMPEEGAGTHILDLAPDEFQMSFLKRQAWIDYAIWLRCRPGEGQFDRFFKNNEVYTIPDYE